jgi:hypothetical protein
MKSAEVRDPLREKNKSEMWYKHDIAGSRCSILQDGPC